MFSTFIASAQHFHLVVADETLGTIANKYAITIDSLIGSNQYIKNRNNIYPRQVLIILQRGQEAYQVRTGDTLYRISRKLGIPILL